MNSDWVELINHHPIRTDVQKILNTSIDQVSKRQIGNFTKPMIFPFKKDGNWKIDLDFDKVLEILGPQRIVEVIDVLLQSEVKRPVSLEQWIHYMKRSPDLRFRILNILSLEISGTKLAQVVNSPPIVKELDWIEMWPEFQKKPKCCLKNSLLYPQVQKVCFLWLEWMIEFF
jgi:hypothetical protein